MTDYEFWSLIISALAAIGTLAAVGVSLWLASGRFKKYSIKDIRVSAKVKSEAPDTPYESIMYVNIENHQNVQMEIFSLNLVFHKTEDKSSSGTSWTCNNEFIPPLSQYELPVKLDQGWANGSLQKADEIKLSIKTSFGDKTTDFPKKYKGALFLSLEVPAKPERKLEKSE